MRVPSLVLSLLAGSLWLGSLAGEARAANASASAGRHKPDPSAEFFSDRKVRTFDLEISETELASLKQNPRSYIRGNVREGGQVFTNVGIHLKGMGSFQPLDKKPSFVLKFDKLERE